MRHILVILAALTLGCGSLQPTLAPVTPEQVLRKPQSEPSTSAEPSSPELLARLSPFYRSQRRDEPEQCPGRSRLALHGECWRKVDVEVECRKGTTEGEEGTVPQSACLRAEKGSRG